MSHDFLRIPPSRDNDIYTAFEYGYYDAPAANSEQEQALQDFLDSFFFKNNDLRILICCILRL